MNVSAKTTLLEFLELTALEDMRFRSVCNDANIDGEIFGGQYLGQSLAAAMASAPGYCPQMLSGFFLRDARADRPLEFSVEMTRSGRRFAHRQVRAWQSDREVFRAEIALGVPDPDQPRHQAAMPCVTGPEGLVSLHDLGLEHAASIGEAAVARLISKGGWETRPLDPGSGFGVAAREPRGRYWIKARFGAPDGGSIQENYAGLAYLTDVMANYTSRMTHVGNAFGNELSALSLNHCIWFHATPRMEDWLLFDLESCHAGEGVGSNRGLIFGRDGALVASIAQNAMVCWTS